MGIYQEPKPRFQDTATAAYMNMVDEGLVRPSTVGIGLAHGVALAVDNFPNATAAQIEAHTFDMLGYGRDGAEPQPNEAELDVVRTCAIAVVEFANQGVSA